MKKLTSLFLALVMICLMIPTAAASTIYKAKEMKVKHDGWKHQPHRHL